jgi:hypothetical protein
MEFLAYGEDALTLWALKEQLSEILRSLKDCSAPELCRIFYRPSFGRRENCFGEFDFIILASKTIYLGESKWTESNEKITDGVFDLREEQVKRHKLFPFYVSEWAFGKHSSWNEFRKNKNNQLQLLHAAIPGTKTLLAQNLRTVLGIIKKYYSSKPVPDIKNVLLFLHNGKEKIPLRAGENFEVVPINYSEITFDNFIRLTL